MSGVPEEDGFDPRGLLAALHRNDVSYVLIGGLARVIRGTDEVTSGVDVCPALRFRQPGSAGGGARPSWTRSARTGGGCRSTRSRCGPSRSCGCAPRWGS